MDRVGPNKLPGGFQMANPAALHFLSDRLNRRISYISAAKSGQAMRAQKLNYLRGCLCKRSSFPDLIIDLAHQTARRCCDTEKGKMDLHGNVDVFPPNIPTCSSRSLSLEQFPYKNATNSFKFK
jgi:hypothetical protein